ncbi:ATP-binding protein [Rhodococcus sp. T2V]|nr:ATP-binding protein [Rhodococcus sp. T2V]MDF3312900.1 ATP-binding protein [Rhodococcus sp. T2V]
MTALYARADKLFARLRAARLDNSVEAEMRRIATVDLPVLDDFALRPLDATETNDFYELVVERHRRKATIVSSNRSPHKAHRFVRTCARCRLKSHRSASRVGSTRSAK